MRLKYVAAHSRLNRVLYVAFSCDNLCAAAVVRLVLDTWRLYAINTDPSRRARAPHAGGRSIRQSDPAERRAKPGQLRDRSDAARSPQKLTGDGEPCAHRPSSRASKGGIGNIPA